MQSFSIIDCYIDEPTCLGVPPYISPYPRYIAGAILERDPQSIISYYTIDQFRKDEGLITKLDAYDIVIFIAGISVPGKYLAGYPASPRELIFIASNISNPFRILCGPAAKYGMGTFGGKTTSKLEAVTPFDIQITGDPEIVISDLLKSDNEIDEIETKKTRTNASQISSFAQIGASIVQQHPFYPHRLITEIETYRGCSRSFSGGCSFCCEPLKGAPDFRSPQEIIQEVNALYKVGIRHIRLGSQPCLFSYMAHNATSKEYPQPNPDAIHTLFSGIHGVAPDLKTFHIDNVNPGIIARYPEESLEIAQIIIKYHTPGDVAAFGVESIDPTVIEMNNLKADEKEVLQAITLFNQVGKNKG